MDVAAYFLTLIRERISSLILRLGRKRIYGLYGLIDLGITVFRLKSSWSLKEHENLIWVPRKDFGIRFQGRFVDFFWKSPWKDSNLF